MSLYRYIYLIGKYKAMEAYGIIECESCHMISHWLYTISTIHTISNLVKYKVVQILQYISDVII